MEILDFFRDPAINTISNIVLVSALVWVTWKYVKKVNEQTEFMVKDRQRPQIVDEVQKVISPFLSACEKTIESIEKPDYNFGWNRGEKGDAHLYGFKQLELYSDERSAEKDFYHKYPSLKEKIDIYNHKLSELEEYITVLINDIISPEFTEMLGNEVIEFNNGKSSDFQVRGKLENHIPRIVAWILENNIEPDKFESDRPLISFWSEKSESFLEIREKQNIKQKLKRMRENIKSLKEVTTDIKGQLEEIKENYRSEYNLTVEELPSFRGVM